jgi:hypothetical protein
VSFEVPLRVASKGPGGDISNGVVFSSDVLRCEGGRLSYLQPHSKYVQDALRNERVSRSHPFYPAHRRLVITEQGDMFVE